MLCVRAPELEIRLTILAKLSGKTKSHYVREALEHYLALIDPPHCNTEFNFLRLPPPPSETVIFDA